MPQKIQRFPGGFLELLGIKGLGLAPPLVGDLVTPGLELRDFYAASNLARASAVAGCTAEGSTAVLTVPQGIMWDMRAVAAEVAYPAATTMIGVVMQVSMGSAASADIFDRRYPAGELDGAGGGQVDAAWFIPDRLLLPSGSIITARLRELVGVANVTAWSINALFHAYAVN